MSSSSSTECRLRLPVGRRPTIPVNASVDLRNSSDALVEKMDASNIAMNSMRAQFIQRREISLLKELNHENIVK